jgi:hypothetical protein
MRFILIIALLICLAVFLGWISYSDKGDSASINIDKHEAREETEEAVDAVEEAVDDAAENIETQLETNDEVETQNDDEIEIERDRQDVPL